MTITPETYLAGWSSVRINYIILLLHPVKRQQKNNILNENSCSVYAFKDVDMENTDPQQYFQ